MEVKKIKNEVLVETLERLKERSLAYDATVEQEREKNIRQSNLMYWIEHNSGLLKKHHKASFDNYFCETEKQKEIVKDLKNYSQKKGSHILLLYGNSGTGKSHLAASAVIENRGFYITYGWLSARIRSSYSYKTKETEIEILEKLIKTPLLVLDEIDKGVNSESKTDLLGLICRERYENEKPTWLVGNVTWEWVKKYIDKSVLDRCKDSGKSFLFDWESYRLRSKNDILHKD